MKNLKVAINDFEYAREAFLRCNEIALQTGLSALTEEEINEEINAVRNAKSSH